MRTYTISEVAKIMDVAPSTLRYYDNEGLLPFVDRVNGRRVFKDDDFKGLRIIHCLRNTGMPVKEIKKYIDLCQDGDDTLEERLQIILKQKESILQQLEELQTNLKHIEFKEWYYRTAIEAGTAAIHEGRPCEPTLEPETIPTPGNE